MSQIEKLPNLILDKIVSELSKEQIINFAITNKFFLRKILYIEEKFANNLWSKLCLKEWNQFDEIKLKKEISEVALTDFDCEVNSFYLFIKYSNPFVQKDSPNYHFSRDDNSFEVIQTGLNYFFLIFRRKWKLWLDLHKGDTKKGNERVYIHATKFSVNRQIHRVRDL